jgi:hypothetical protein
VPLLKGATSTYSVSVLSSVPLFVFVPVPVEITIFPLQFGGCVKVRFGSALPVTVMLLLKVLSYSFDSDTFPSASTVTSIVWDPADSGPIALSVTV